MSALNLPHRDERTLADAGDRSARCHEQTCRQQNSSGNVFNDSARDSVNMPIFDDKFTAEESLFKILNSCYFSTAVIRAIQFTKACPTKTAEPLFQFSITALTSRAKSWKREPLHWSFTFGPPLVRPRLIATNTRKSFVAFCCFGLRRNVAEASRQFSERGFRVQNSIAQSVIPIRTIGFPGGLVQDLL
jgi:hypothetical protein